MSNVLLESSIVKWLKTLDLLKDENIMGPAQDNKLQIDNYISSLLINGILIGNILEKCSIKSKQSEYLSPLTSLKSLKSATTASGKLYNWSILCDVFKKLNIPIDSEIKALIVAGDTHLINEILKELYNSFNVNSSSQSNSYTHVTSNSSAEDQIQVKNKDAYENFMINNEKNSQTERVYYYSFCLITDH